MGRMKLQLGFTSLFSKPRESSTSSPSSSSWPWPSCKQQPRTNSFRASGDVVKTSNSAYLDSTESSWFTNSSDESFSTASEEVEDPGGSEAVIRGMRSERLFFEPGDTSSSVLVKAKAPFKESVVMAMDSEDPYRDFRVSMEEVVAAQGMKEWESMEEMLVWYLRVNEKSTHGYIAGAFLDLVLGLAAAASFTCSCSSSSSSMLFEIEEVKDGGDGDDDDGEVEESSGSC